jgi:hypothetical protein
LGLEVKINCLSTYIDPKNKEIVSQGAGKSKKELEAGEPSVEIPVQTARAQDLEIFGLTKQDVNKRAEERMQKRYGGNAKNIDIR